MKEWKEAIMALAAVIESPLLKKGYIELQNFYDSAGKTEYADAIKHLIQLRFEATVVTDDPNIGQK